MKKVYIYVLDTLADWEIGYIMAELNSRRFFKKDASDLSITVVGCDLKPIVTMGGFSIQPQCTVKDIIVDDASVLLLPGADEWGDAKHHDIVRVAEEILLKGGVVAAICGATVALADFGLLNERPHTSNGEGFLEYASQHYKGQVFYETELAVSSNNLITASASGSLLWAKYILDAMKVFNDDTLEYWSTYFREGTPESYFAMVQSLDARA